MSKYHFITLRDTKKVYYWEDGVYVEYGETLIEVECEKIIPDCSNYKVREVTGIIKRRTDIPRSKINADLSKLVLENGILDLETFEFSDFDPEFLTTIKIPIPYDPKARCLEFLKFLKYFCQSVYV